MSSPIALPRGFHPAWKCDGCGRPPYRPPSSHKKMAKRFGVRARPSHLKLVHVRAVNDAAWLCRPCRKLNRVPVVDKEGSGRSNPLISEQAPDTTGTPESA